MKKKIFMPFESSRDHYKAEATVVWCSDDRFSLALQVFREKMGWRWMDLIRVAGGAHDLGTTASSDEANALLGYIGKSIKGSHSPQVFLMAHYDCSSYGREQTEQNDDEDRFFSVELSRAKERVENYLKSVGLSATVRTFLLDFKNVYEVDF